MVHFLLTCHSLLPGLTGRPWSLARLLADYLPDRDEKKQQRALQQLRV